jgi:hypothetical protein
VGDAGASTDCIPGGDPCCSAAGGFPQPDCDPSDEMACGTALPSGCTISPQCTTGSSACEAFTSNTGSTDNFRMRLINIAAPSTLATTFVQGDVVTAQVDLVETNGGPTCGENGSGTFNWLLSVDKGAGTVTTGGAPFSMDPFGTGFCYINSTLVSLPVAPVTMSATFNGNTFSTAKAKTVLNIPIFSSQTDYSNVVILPITAISFQNVTVSTDNNCIGTVNNNSIQAGTCTNGDPAGPQSCSRWKTAGALGGYITLKQADKVQVVQLSETLCALLTGENDNNACPADAFTKGDYCSTTESPGGCQDSFWISATFAASAVNIDTSGSISICPK